MKSVTESTDVCRYDNGVTGGVVAMPGFLEDFFPEVLQHVDARSDGETS